MKKLLFISLIALISCDKHEIKCYECIYQFYNEQLDTTSRKKGIECVTEEQIKQIEYKNNAKCELK